MYYIFEQLLQERGLRTVDVCKATGISQSTISNWKRRGNMLNPGNLKKVADFFGVSLDYMMGKNIAWDPDSQDIYFVNEIQPKTKAKCDFLVSINSTKFGEDNLIEMLDTISEVDERYEKELLSMLKTFAKMSKGE